MRWSDVIKLITITFTENNIGDIISSNTERTVYANKKSIRQQEFYQAQATGLKPEIMFEIRTAEYNNESLLLYGNKEYNIIRTYDKNGEITELICSGVVNNATT